MNITHLFALLILNCSAVIIRAQAPPVDWSFSFGGSNIESASKMSELNDGRIIVCGSTSSDDKDLTSNKGGSDACLILINRIGKKIWHKTYGGSGEDYFGDVKVCQDKGFIICGSSTSSDGDLLKNNGTHDLWVLKTDTAGNLIWSRTYGGSKMDRAAEIRELPDGGYVVIGTTESKDGDVNANKGHENIWLLKLDVNGNIVWQKTYGGSRSEAGLSLDICKDNGFILCGYSSSDDGDLTVHYGESDIWVLKINTSGNIVWQRKYGQAGYESGRCVRECKEGGFIISGEFYQLNNYGWDIWVLKLNSAGGLLWDRKIGGSSYDWSFSVSQCEDNGFIVIGNAASRDGQVMESKGERDIWFLKFTNYGNIEWSKAIGGSKSDHGFCVLQSQDGAYLACGSSYSSDKDLLSNNGETDWWVIKLLPDPLILSADKVVCIFQELNVKTNKPGKIKRWSVNGQFQGYADSLSIKFPLLGKYLIKAEIDSFGFSLRDSITVSVIDLPKSLVPGKIKGCEPLDIRVCLNLNQSQIRAGWNDGNTDTCRVFTKPGIYIVVLDNSVCTSIDSIEIIELKAPDFRILQRDTPCFENGVYTKLQLNADTFPGITWSDGSTGSELIIYKSNPVSVKVKGSNSCISEAGFSPVNGCKMKIFLPEAFSPNNDGLNDIFILYGSQIAEAKMQIFNRWGEMVFEGDALRGWDGYFMGEMVQEGTYFVCLTIQSVQDASGASPFLFLSQKVILLY